MITCGHAQHLADLLSHLLNLLGYLLACIFNLLLSSEKDKNVTSWLADMDLHNSSDGCFQVIPLRLLQVLATYERQPMTVQIVLSEECCREPRCITTPHVWDCNAAQCKEAHVSEAHGTNKTAVCIPAKVCGTDKGLGSCM